MEDIDFEKVNLLRNINNVKKKSGKLQWRMSELYDKLPYELPNDAKDNISTLEDEIRELNTELHSWYCEILGS